MPPLAYAADFFWGAILLMVSAWCQCRLTMRCSEPYYHKVLSRGRPSPARGLAPRARVLMRRRAVAELGS
jgi:hypothetical protein